jgi:predicted esterase
MVENEEQKHGIKPERICIGGFSQGGAVALHAGLTSGKKLGGIIALSSWIPLHTKVTEVSGFILAYLSIMSLCPLHHRE